MNKNILINFPSNLGDVILALPALDKVKANYPDSKICAIVSLRTRDFLVRNNIIDEVVLFDKQWKMPEKAKFAISLRGKFDIVIDFKNSFLPVILGAKIRTPFLRVFPKNMHIKDKYLKVIKNIAAKDAKVKSEFVLSPQKKQKWSDLKIAPSLFIGCSSLSPIKTYPYEYLKQVISLINHKYPIVVAGQEKDREFYRDILAINGVLDLVGKTTMAEMFYLLKNYARLILTVDSSILHLGSYLNIPTIALFGPTDPGRSHPYSEQAIILRDEKLSCLPCEGVRCEIDNQCMKIDPQRVIESIDKLW